MKWFFAPLLVIGVLWAIWFYGLGRYDQVAMTPTKAQPVGDIEATKSADLNEDVTTYDHEQETVVSGREAALPIIASLDPNLLEESANATDFLLKAADTYSWSEDAALQTAQNWKASCEIAGEIGLYRDITLEKLLEVLGQSYVDMMPFGEFCLGFYDPDTGTLSEELRSELLSRTTARQYLPYRDWRTMDRLIDDDPASARDELISQLNRALLNFDEAQVDDAVGFLVMPKTRAIRPNLPERPFALYRQYVAVIRSVSWALLCEHHGGCFGQSHPLVLRTCVAAYQTRGVGCVQPQDILDAIYQTQTPIEQMHFLHLLDEINGMLRAYRRR